MRMALRHEILKALAFVDCNLDSSANSTFHGAYRAAARVRKQRIRQQHRAGNISRWISSTKAFLTVLEKKASELGLEMGVGEGMEANAQIAEVEPIDTATTPVLLKARSPTSVQPTPRVRMIRQTPIIRRHPQAVEDQENLTDKRPVDWSKATEDDKQSVMEPPVKYRDLPSRRRRISLARARQKSLSKERSTQAPIRYKMLTFHRIRRVRLAMESPHRYRWFEYLEEKAKKMRMQHKWRGNIARESKKSELWEEMLKSPDRSDARTETPSALGREAREALIEDVQGFVRGSGR